MSNLGKILAMTGIMAAMAEKSLYSESGLGLSYNVNPDPEWKRKKCKSCKHVNKYGSYCGTALKYTSINHQACERYSKRKK